MNVSTLIQLEWGKAQHTSCILTSHADSGLHDCMFHVFYCFPPLVNVPTTVMEAMSRQETLQPLSKTGKGFSVALLRSMVFPHSPCSRSFSLMDKGGHTDSGFNQMSSKNQRVLASPTSTSQLSTEFSDWHLWKCGQCFKTFTQRILLQMHVCTQNPDR